jgi:hypothetical protein
MRSKFLVDSEPSTVILLFVALSAAFTQAQAPDLETVGAQDRPGTPYCRAVDEAIPELFVANITIPWAVAAPILCLVLFHSVCFTSRE